jgi:preprotein translocase subunit SecG
MTTVLLLIHLFVTLALIGVVLIQRSEGGGLGIGSSQGMGAFMSGRGTANLLTRTTAILGTLFFALSLALALLNRGTSGVGRSIMDAPLPAAPAPVTAPLVPGSPATPSPATPAAPTPGAPAPTAPVPPASGTPSAPAPATAPAAPADSGPTVPTK